jgi:non-specific serine/threonine protein kinase/serine/threonine-protein kinase
MEWRNVTLISLAMDDDLPRILQLVVEAVDSGRTAEEVTADYPELLPEVSQRLKLCRLLADELTGLFPSRSPVQTSPRSNMNVGEPLGALIGPYNLIKQIGEGGFGTVYMAEQESPIRRRVAVKVIKPGMDSREVVGRFESERQALALMDHPNIAQVFDAGTTDAGRPYFVMELVLGVPITGYCDDAKIGIKERLKLMVPICRAVQSAHGKGIIHRDLKPSNVLVTINNGVPIPKIIDFGVAKATGGSPTERTLFTGLGLFVGTPAYMSPEQAERSGDGIDTRTDIYALGVLLYELLTGTTPIDPKILKAAAYSEVPRLIREVEPARPSTRLSTVGGSTAVSAARRSCAWRLERRLRGELDCIVMKAIEKDRERRYDTAAALADDLERYLAGDPIAAAPPGAIYRFTKFARKHRVSLGATALVVLGLVLGVAGLSVGLVRAASARRLAEARQVEAEAQRRLAQQRQIEAETQRRQEEAVAEFLTNDILAKASPTKTQDKAVRDILVRALIEPAIRTVDQQFSDQPIIRAQIQFTLAHTLNELGRPDLAETQAKASWSTRREMLGATDKVTIVALDEYCVALARQGRWTAVEPLVKEEWKGFCKVEGNDGPDTIFALMDYAGTLIELNRWPEAKKVVADTVAAERFNGRAKTPGFAALLVGIGEIQIEYGDWRAAIDPLREATDLYRAVAPDDPACDHELFWLGMCLMATGHAANANAVFAQRYQWDLKYASTSRPTPGNAALDAACKAIRTFAAAPVAQHQSGRALAVLFADLLFSGGDFLRQTGNIAAAVPLLQEAVDLLRTAAPDDPHRGRDLYWLGNCLLATGRPAQAEIVFRENYVYDLTTTGSELPVVSGSLQGLLASLLAQGKPADAPAIRRAYRSVEAAAIRLSDQ